MSRDEGFTLIELMVISLLIAVMVTLGATAINHYWKLQALEGSAEEVSTELRGLQQDSGSESHPWVNGAYFRVGTNRWGIVRGNISTGACSVTARRTFPAGVTVSAASFVDITTMSLTSNCTTAAEAGAEIVFFLARGSATSGTISLSHPAVADGPRTIDVSSLTGRVTGP